MPELLSALTSQRKASRAWLVVSRTDNILSTATINFELRIVPLGYPVEPFPKKLARRPLSDICFGDAWGEPALR